jgi:hypothetical protein
MALLQDAAFACLDRSLETEIYFAPFHLAICERLVNFEFFSSQLNSRTQNYSSRPA